MGAKRGSERSPQARILDASIAASGAEPRANCRLSRLLASGFAARWQNDEAALGCGRCPRGLDREVLFRDVVLHLLGQQVHRFLHEFDGDPFSLATVIAVPLRDKVEGAPIPLTEPAGHKHAWLVSNPGNAVGAVE